MGTRWDCDADAGCRAYLLGHGSLETMVAVMRCHERETPVLVTSLLFVDTATMTRGREGEGGA